MNKCHTNLNWVNNTTPAINATNLNYMDGCLDTIDDRVITLDSAKAQQTDLLTAMADWNVNNSTGDVTITLKSGQTIVRHTNLGKIAINVQVIHDPSDPHYQQMEITLPDGTKDYVDFSAFVTPYEFTDSSEIHANVANNGQVSFSLINGSITGDKLQPNYLADCRIAKTGAESAATQSDDSRLVSEGYANGTQNGVPVSEDSPYRNNNAKYWSEHAQAIAAQSLDGLSNVGISNPQNNEVLAYKSAQGKWVNSSMAIPDVTVKADKVVGAVSGNFAGLDANGNLTDSGHKHSDYLTQHQDITGKADKVINATSGNLASLDASGNLVDSGVAATSAKDGTVTSIIAGTGLTGGTITQSGTIAINFGNTAGTACEGNDSRLSDARTPVSHTHAASEVTAGTLGGKVLANATSVATLSDKQVRNVYAGTTDLTAGSSALPTGDIYFVYE